MITSPVDRKVQKITQFYKGTKHRGIDLRSVSHLTWLKHKIIVCEDSTLKRIGRDNYGNGFVVIEPMESDYKEIKYIHINIDKIDIKKGAFLCGGDFLAYTEVAGNSKSHHLHWEVWNKTYVNPLQYFNKFNLRYK